MRADHVQAYLRPDLPAHKVEQDDNAFVVGRTFKPSDMIGERAGHNLHFSAPFERNFAAGHYQSAIVFFVLQYIDNARRHRDRSTLVADQMRHSDS